jgi:hypothetical protein
VAEFIVSEIQSPSASTKVPTKPAEHHAPFFTAIACANRSPVYLQCYDTIYTVSIVKEIRFCENQQHRRVQCKIRFENNNVPNTTNFVAPNGGDGLVSGGGGGADNVPPTNVVAPNGCDSLVSGGGGGGGQQTTYPTPPML